MSGEYPTFEMQERAIRSLLAHPCLDERGRVALLCRFLDVSRKQRRLRVAQWEIGYGLVDGWHGSPDDLVVAAKELSK